MDKFLVSLHGSSAGLDPDRRLIHRGQRVHLEAYGTATAVAGAATLNKSAGKVTSEALTTAAAALYTLTLTNSEVAAADMVFASVANGTATTGSPVVEKITPAAGSVVIIVRNSHAATAFDGTIVVSFFVVKAPTS